MLLTKLHIPLPGENLVHRTPLFEKLNEGLKRKLILVSAPAGFGKTTIIADWIHENKIPTAWFSIDNNNNDVVDFLNYIVAAIQTINKEIGLNAQNLLSSPNSAQPESVINLLINDILNIKEDFLLVLDDFHLINNTEVIKISNYLLEHAPENIHLVIITRADPNFPIAKLRSKHQLLELRSSDLSFSATDISNLYNKNFKLKLSTQDIQALEAKTEGWIAGLQLAAISLQAHEDKSAFIEAFAGDNRYIMDYLIEEVLKVQTDEIKDFLLSTSILEQISAPLCDMLLNREDSQLVLEKLEKNNMFLIPLDEKHKWYRYHHLFAQLLKQRLQFKSKPLVVGLHEKAIEWFEKNGMFTLAINHAFEINNYQKAIELIAVIIEELWKSGQHSSILRYGKLLPEEFINNNADFSLYYSWILMISGQAQKAELYLSQAENLVRKTISSKSCTAVELQHNKKLLGKISVAFAYMYSFQAMQASTLEYCQTAMEYLTEEDPLWFSWGWYSLGSSHMANENFQECLNSYAKALEYGKKAENVFLISTIAMNLAYLESRMGLYSSSFKKCSDLIAFMNEKGYAQLTKTECSYAALYSCMAGIQCMRAEIDEALENIKISYALSKNESNFSFKTVILLVYALVLKMRGDTAGFKSMLDEAEAIVNSNKIAQGAKSIFVSFKCFTHIEHKELEKAKYLLEVNGITPETKITYVNDRNYFPLVMILLFEGKIGEAEKLLLELESMSLAANRVETLVDTKIFQSVLLNIKGDKENAVNSMVKALEVASAEGIILSFIIYSYIIEDLLTAAFKKLSNGNSVVPKSVIDKIKLALEKKEKAIQLQKESELSSREADTLKLMSENLSNQEIADKMFISLNTAKTHVRNILQKLDAENRLQAVAKAREQGMI